MTDWMSEFAQIQALWIHGGQLKRPHALLTSGLHSNGYVNGTLITQRPVLLLRILREPGGLASQLPAERVDWVIGSALGAITFAYAVAEQLEARAGYTEKDGDAMKLARFELQDHERVLIVEDTLSTGGSTRKTIKAVESAAGGKAVILPFILCLVNRSGRNDLDGRAIRSLIQPDIQMWKAEECPLCKAGSKALRPKENWKELQLAE